MANCEVDLVKRGFVVALAFDPKDHERVFYATAYGLFSWEWKNKAKPRELFTNDPKGKKVLDPAIRDFTISPNGRHIAIIDSNQRVVLMDIESKTMKIGAITESQESQNPSFEENYSIKHGTVSFSPDSLTIAQTTRNEISLYDIKTRKELRRLKGHTDVVDSLCFVNNETLLSASWDGTCRTWSTGIGHSTVVELGAKARTCPFVARAPDGKRFVCAYDGEIAVFSFPGLKEIKRIRGPKSGFTGIAFLRDPRFLITSGESPRVQFWDIDEGREVEKR
jgi:WD40 repeat protein